MNIMVQPVTSILPDSLLMSASSAQRIDPAQLRPPSHVTTVMGSVEKLNRVSATSRIFLRSVHLLEPISRARRT